MNICQCLPSSKMNDHDQRSRDWLRDTWGTERLRDCGEWHVRDCWYNKHRDKFVSPPPYVLKGLLKKPMWRVRMVTLSQSFFLFHICASCQNPRHCWSVFIHCFSTSIICFLVKTELSSCNASRVRLLPWNFEDSGFFSWTCPSKEIVSQLQSHEIARAGPRSFLS